MSNSARLETYKRADRDWGVRLRAPNGRVLFSTEGYVSQRGAVRAAKTILCHAASAKIVDEEKAGA